MFFSKYEYKGAWYDLDRNVLYKLLSYVIEKPITHKIYYEITRFIVDPQCYDKSNRK